MSFFPITHSKPLFSGVYKETSGLELVRYVMLMDKKLHFEKKKLIRKFANLSLQKCRLIL